MKGKEMKAECVKVSVPMNPTRALRLARLFEIAHADIASLLSEGLKNLSPRSCTKRNAIFRTEGLKNLSAMGETNAEAQRRGGKEAAQ